MTANEIKTMAIAIAAELGHAAKITATQASSSEKLGRQIRVRVATSEKKRTWSIMRAIGWELNRRIGGRVIEPWKFAVQYVSA